jgi:CheY-like chemotaxis protein
MKELPNSNIINTHFLANTIHEIRTPIQTISGTLELLQDTTLDTEQAEYVRQLRFSADVLLTLSNDILDFSKISSGQFSIERISFNIIDTVEQIFDLVCIEAYNKHLELITDIDYTVPCSILGDPTRIQQVLLNLIKNAVKFTTHGYIRLAVHPRKENTLLLFEIQDSGIGISDEKKKEIFADYVQGDASISRQYGGTGLGLAICKNLVHLMGGKIGIKDNPHKGSIFWFTIPLLSQAPEKPLTLKTKYMSTVSPTLKILLVDDNVLALQSLRLKLQTLGANQVDIAQNGAQALVKMKNSALQKTPYDLAMIDMVMPIMDGWRLAAIISGNKLINSTKLYLIIPEGQLGGEAKMKMLDWFNGYIYKPIKLKMLSDMLHVYFNTPLDLEVLPDKRLQNETHEISHIHNLKVLVAEDHPVNRKLIGTFLFQLQTMVYTATNGEEAVQDVLQHPDIDLIFMDIQMPKKNGIEATKEIRAAGYKGIIIACTANNDENSFQQYLENGMNDVLVKPFKRQNVQSILKKWQQVFESPMLASKSQPSSVFWDIRDMLDTTGNDEKLALELIQQYLTQTQKLLDNAQIQSHKGDTNKLMKIAHTIKGSSAALSINGVAKPSKLCEDSARDEDLPMAQKYLKQIEAAYLQFCIFAKEKLKTGK